VYYPEGEGATGEGAKRPVGESLAEASPAQP
jgi:hypothetical protein